MKYFKITPTTASTAPSDYFAKAAAFCEAWATGQATFVRHTSGSTGSPKPILLNRVQMQASAKLTQQALHLKAGQTALVCLPVDFIAGTMMLVRGMEVGLEMYVVVPSSNPLADVPESTKIDFMAVVPLQLQTMLQNGLVQRLNQCAAIIVGGTAVSQTLLTQIQQLEAPVFSTYGMTETVSHVALRRLNGKAKSDFYQLLPQIEATTDHRDCLRLRGAVTNNEWIQTNDVVQFIDNQHFLLLGRADNIINSGGIKIQLEKVEVAIEKTGALADVRFFAWHRPDERLGQALVLVVEKIVTADQRAMLSLLKMTLTAHLSVYEIPKEMYFTKKFVETPTGKINKPATFEAINPTI